MGRRPRLPRCSIGSGGSVLKKALAFGLLLVCLTRSAWADIPLGERQSGVVLLSPGNRAMQDDLSLNPASLWLMEGQALWQQAPGPGQQACQACHGPVERSMKGVAARFPRLVDGQLLNLEGQINRCRQVRQEQAPWRGESSPLLALSALIALQSRGMPIQVPAQASVSADLAAGRRLFEQRMGQINLSCAQCHDQRWGLQLGGVTIPQAHPTGYPIYRLEWQSMGSLERRLRNCMNAVRAEPFAPGAIEWRQLELFLQWRARGMPMESPAVRP